MTVFTQDRRSLHQTRPNVSPLRSGFFLYSMWGWNVICAPDIFTWNFLFVLLNMGQVLHIIYQMRPVKFNQELEELYGTLFEPLRVG